MHARDGQMIITYHYHVYTSLRISYNIYHIYIIPKTQYMSLIQFA